MIRAQRFIGQLVSPLVGILVTACAWGQTNGISGNQHTKLLQRFETAALTQAGDRERGRKLFADDSRTKCATCHRVSGVGAEVGPDLSVVGGKFDRPHLIEALLEPSRQIVEGYRSTTFQLRDGQVISGIVKTRSDDVVRVVDAAGNTMEMVVQDIDDEQASSVSLMPDGLATQLDEHEFVDLVAYLESLQSGPDKFGSGVSGPIRVPDGFAVRTVATGLNAAVAMELLPDGRLLICEQAGSLRVVENDILLPRPFATVPALLDWERGLIGVTVSPDFVNDSYVYVCYVTASPYPHHVVSRWTAEGNVARTDSEQVLLRGDDQRTLGGNVPAGHQGGALHFGPDGCLYIGIGEQTAGLPSQHLDTYQGKLLRIRPDGSVPADNPFVDQAAGKYRAIWAMGLRNPFTFAFDHESGELLINDVGGKFEEINRGRAGANYGWPVVEHGPTSDERFVGPIHGYPQASIGGGAFIPTDAPWPDVWRRKYLFADFVHGWIHAIDPVSATFARRTDAMEFARGLRRPVDLRLAPDGSLYVLLRNAWVADDKLAQGTSSLMKIVPPGVVRPEVVPAEKER